MRGRVYGASKQRREEKEMKLERRRERKEEKR